jgi:hypothetical protein
MNRVFILFHVLGLSESHRLRRVGFLLEVSDPIPPISMTPVGPAPSAVNMNAAMNPGVISVSANNKPACPAAGAAVPGTAPGATASNTCVIAASTQPDATASTGTIVASVLGGIIGLVTIAAIVQKYKTMGSYSSFWGRMVGLFSGAAAVGVGYMDFASYSDNQCNNFMGDAFMSSPCPCLVCVYLLWGYGGFQLIFNLPFLYAGEKTTSKWYASFGLFSQAGAMGLVSAGCAAGIRFASGSITGMLICCLGLVVAVMFLLGWFKGEDGVLSRMFQSAKDMLSEAGAAANLMVDDGLKMFGLNADERTKVGTHNVYTFCKVVRGPDWMGGDEDGEGPGELIGYIGDDGVADGVAVSTGRPGWAKVKWENTSKTLEHRIGADRKFELKFADSESTDGVVDKLMGQTWALFGYDPNADEKRKARSEKRQIEFTLTSRMPGEEEVEPEENPAADSDDDEEKKPKGVLKPKIITDPSTTLVMTCEVFSASTGRLVDRCDEVKPSLFKSAIRHRQLAQKQDAIVVELQKLPAEASLLLLWAKVPEKSKLGKFERLGIRATTTGKDIPQLSVSQQEGSQAIASHKGSDGILWLVLYATDDGAGGVKWFASKPAASLGSGNPSGSLDVEATKFLAAREKLEKKKKSAEPPTGITKNISDLTSVDSMFDQIKLELRCEAQARDLMNAKLESVSAALAARLRAQGVPQPDAQAKKIALVQINKQHQLIYQRTLVVRRAYYLKLRMHPVLAMAAAKKDANRAALYDGKESEVRQAVLNSIAEEKAAAEETKRQEEAEYANTYTGQATAALSAVWGGWGAAEEPKKKKKKKKKKEEVVVEETPTVAAPTAPALPPQFANLSPEQLTALRTMQQKQKAAAQKPPDSDSD